MKKGYDEIFFLFLNLDIVLKNSTPGELTYIFLFDKVSCLKWRLKQRKSLLKPHFCCCYQSPSLSESCGKFPFESWCNLIVAPVKWNLNWQIHCIVLFIALRFKFLLNFVLTGNQKWVFWMDERLYVAEVVI